MSWIILALLGPLLWAMSSIVDKYALEKISRGNYDFLFFRSIGSAVVAVVAWLLFGLGPLGWFALVPVLGGFLLQYSYSFYSHALRYEDASYVVPLYITYSVVVLVLGPLFGETVTASQLLSFAIVFLGGLILSRKEISFKLISYRRGALLMLPAILLVSLYALVIDQSLEVLPFTDTFILDLIGFTLAGCSFMLVPLWRREIMLGLKSATPRKFFLFFFNDALDIGAHLIYKAALVLAPSVSLVAVLGGIQPFYVLILGASSTVFFPHIVKENISQKELAQKIVGTVIIVIGITLLQLVG